MWPNGDEKIPQFLVPATLNPDSKTNAQIKIYENLGWASLTTAGVKALLKSFKEKQAVIGSWKLFQGLRMLQTNYDFQWEAYFLLYSTFFRRLGGQMTNGGRVGPCRKFHWQIVKQV